jgi:hypothetical protein
LASTPSLESTVHEYWPAALSIPAAGGEYMVSDFYFYFGWRHATQQGEYVAM